MSANQGRIAKVDLFTISVPFGAPEESATLSRLGFDNVLVRLETAEGTVGWGEASGGSGAPVEVLRAMMEGSKGFVLGRSVFEPELIRSAMIAGGRLANFRRLAHLSMAGFDMACWDAAGKLVGRPIHAPMGGALRREIDFYAYPLAKKPQEVAEEAGRFAARDSRSSISRSAWETSGTWKRFAGRGKPSGRQSGSGSMPTRPGILPPRAA